MRIFDVSMFLKAAWWWICLRNRFSVTSWLSALFDRYIPQFLTDCTNVLPQPQISQEQHFRLIPRYVGMTFLPKSDSRYRSFSAANQHTGRRFPVKDVNPTKPWRFAPEAIFSLHNWDYWHLYSWFQNGLLLRNGTSRGFGNKCCVIILVCWRCHVIHLCRCGPQINRWHIPDWSI